MKEKLKFYDMKAKKSFESNEYRIVDKTVRGKGRRFAVAISPSGLESWRVISSKGG